MSTQFLPSIRDNETITCRRCNTRQYPRSGNCIACHYSLPLRYVKIDIDSLLSSCPQEQRNQIAQSMGMVLRLLRKQRRIQARMRPGTPPRQQTFAAGPGPGPDRGDPALRGSRSAKDFEIPGQWLNNAIS